MSRITSVSFYQRVIVPYRLAFFQQSHALLSRNGLSLTLLFDSSDVIPSLLSSISSRKLLSTVNICSFTFPFYLIIASLKGRKSVLVVPSDLHNFLLVPILLLGVLSATPIFLYGHLLSSRRGNVPVIKLMLFYLAKKIIFYTPREVRLFNSSHSRLATKTYSMSNGLNIENINTLRKSFVPKDRAFNVLYIGRVTNKVNLHFLLESLSHDQTNKLNLYLIGPSSRDIIKCCSNYRLNIDISRVHAFGPLYSEDDIASIANCCLLFAYPGSVGLSMLHSFSYGIPVVIPFGRRYSVPEIDFFRNVHHGLYCLPRDSKSLYNKLLFLYRRPQLVKQLSNNCLDIANSCCNTTSMARNFHSSLLDF
jgi:glycosyltransferase involved in cell wall biosynthesis